MRIRTHHGRYWVHSAFCAVMMFALLARSTMAATPEEINDAITRGKQFLYSRQRNGNWEVVSKRNPKLDPPNNPGGLQYGGMTALVTFALLSCGDTPQSNDNLKQAVEFLEKADIRGTYALGLRAQVWNLLSGDDAAVKTARHRDRDLLERGVRQQFDAAGFFSYGEEMPKQQYDHSVSQFGVLGLWSLNLAGEEVDTRYWRMFDLAWRKQRQGDGAWCYWKEPMHVDQDTGIGGELISMTAAGVATLFITQDYVNATAKCNGNIRDPDIEAGMQWLGQHFDAIDSNDWSKQWQYYTLFGIGRIGLASGYKYIGTTDWFRWGCARILPQQDPNNGSFGSYGGQLVQLGQGADAIDPGVYNTSFALLFLSRGRAPVLFNKLQYNLLGAAKRTAEGNWNQRPRDIANLTRFLGKQSETLYSWQIVNLQEKARDLLDAPILYVSGNQAMKLSPADMDRLKDYVEEGGIILGHADCGATAFAESFKKLGEALFPGETFKPMPLDHPILRNENFTPKSWKNPLHVDLLDNGARVQMLLLGTGDPARDWQTNSFPPLRTYSAGQLLMDIYLYASDKQNLRTKGDTYTVHRNENVSAGKSIKVARLKYTGNWDPEPGGWVRLGNILHNTKQIDLDIQPIELGKGQLSNAYSLADLTGTDAYTLTEPQRAELRKFVDGGGTLLIDSAGGKSAFNIATGIELPKIFPGVGTPNPAVLPLKNSIYTVAGGEPISTAGYRMFARATLPANLQTPQLRSLDFKGQPRVLISNEDVAVGLVGQNVDGIIGYDPQSATKLVENIVLYSAK